MKWRSPAHLIYLRSNVCPNGCWVWQGFLNSDGYGHIPNQYWAKQHKVTKAHQLSYIVYYGEYNRELVIRHSCHNPSCVNPHHLSTGTRSDNTQDMVLAGRCADNKGLKNPRCKLSLEDVFNIRASSMSRKLLATTYNISKENIDSIKLRRTWRHV